MRTRIVLAVGAGSILLLAAHGLTAVRRAAAIATLSRATHSRVEPLAPGERQDMVKRHKQFTLLWCERTRRDPVAGIIPFAADPFPPLCERAVRALGRLEDVRAEPALARVLQSRPTDDPGGRVFTAARLALARTQTRGLPVGVRIDRMAGTVGLSASDLSALSARVNDSAERAWAQGSAGDLVVAEVVDLLCTMRTQGENIDPILGRLALNPAQRVRLRGAGLPPQEEARLILAHLASKGPATTPDDLDLACSRLPELGAAAASETDASLHAAWQQGVRDPQVCLRLITAARAIGDARLLPVLEQYTEHPNYWVRKAAEKARGDVEHGTFVPYCPS